VGPTPEVVSLSSKGKTNVNRLRMTRYVAVAGVAALALSACGAVSSGKSSTSNDNGGTKTGHITIAYMQKQGDQQYFIDEATGAKEAAKTLGDVSVSVNDLGTDSNKAISTMSTQVAQQVDGIAIVVPDQKIGPQIISMADGIPLVASDDPISDGSGKPAPFVGFNSEQMGDSVGTKAGELFKKAGWNASDTRVVAAYQQGLSDCQQREQGEEDGFAKAAGTELKIVKIGTDNSVVDAQNRTAAAITANQGVKHWVVWGCNDENETGAVTALQNSGVAPADIIGVGLGAYLTCKDWAAGKASGNKAALFIDGHAVGASAIKALVAKIRDGKDLPAMTIAPTKIVDASNYEQAGVKCT
jgi:L-arabinose transport system substrate-binding protein